ncbi:hypothetical protein [uncultured Tateyamaria sp.]|uniref:hypothetical protein n=1 Tax=uncultured Tateyamaria sp. TaxID=455651 RepID=UPI00260591C2|nr:hypothetical protein [uncultured Tateyamaria sp.]
MAYTEVMQKRIYMDKERLRAAYKQFAQQLEPELFLTLATNQQMSIGRVQNLTRRFLRGMDQWKHGKRGFMHVDAEQRIDGLFYVEHEHTNIHVQALINRPYCNRFGLQMHANRIWRKLCPSGSVVIKDVDNAGGLSEYCTKEFYKDRFFERQCFTAREFMAAA